MRIGEKIRDVRKRLYMSQKEFGSAIGYSQSAVATWELFYKDPSFEAMQKIFALAKAKRLPIKMGWFFGAS